MLGLLASGMLAAACAPSSPPSPTTKPAEASKPTAAPAAPPAASPAAAASPIPSPGASLSASPGASPAAVTGGGAAPAAANLPPAVKPAALDPNAKPGGSLRIGIAGEWKTLDPPLYTNVTERQIFYAIYNPLFSIDDSFNIQPELVRSWDVSQDALAWTFKLASGVTFHDGTPFNAQAVKFNLDRLLDPKTGAGLRQQLTDISSVDVVDDSTVKISLKQPFTPLLSWLTEGPGFQPSPTAVQKLGADFAQ